MTTPTLSPAQVKETVAALYDRLHETRRYLRSTAPSVTHDDCCTASRARTAALAEQHRALEQREADVLGALRVLDPDTPEGSR